MVINVIPLNRINLKYNTLKHGEEFFNMSHKTVHKSTLPRNTSHSFFPLLSLFFHFHSVSLTRLVHALSVCDRSPLSLAPSRSLSPPSPSLCLWVPGDSGVTAVDRLSRVVLAALPQISVTVTREAATVAREAAVPS